jgi:hypothetical protein
MLILPKTAVLFDRMVRRLERPKKSLLCNMLVIVFVM